MKRIILSLFLALVLSSCVKTIEVVREVPVEVTRYVQRTDTIRTYKSDSVIIHTRGDTVYHTRMMTLYRDKIKERIDTVTKLVTVTETKIEEKEVRVNMWGWTDTGFVILSLILFTYVVWFVRKKVLHLHS